MRKLLSFALPFLAAGIVSAVAETYPSRPITIVVPFPAGGPTDTLGRILAERMKRALDQSVIIENVTGAAGTLGTGRVARAAPDGYTVILGHWQTLVGCRGRVNDHSDRMCVLSVLQAKQSRDQTG